MFRVNRKMFKISLFLYSVRPVINKLRAGDEDLRFYITTVQDG